MNDQRQGGGGTPPGGGNEQGGKKRRRRRSRKRKGPESADPAGGRAAGEAEGKRTEGKRTEGKRTEGKRTEGTAEKRDRPRAAPRPSRAAPRERGAPPEEPPVDGETALADADSGYLLENEERGDFSTMDAELIIFLKPHEVDDEVLLDDLPEADLDARGVLLDVVGVKLHPAGVIAACECEDLHIGKGDPVIVETGRGLALGEAVVPSTRRRDPGTRLPKVIRKATPNDTRQRDRNIEKERAAFSLCREQIAMQGLPMKLISVDYLHGGNKAMFYFSAEKRVDFRDLVRDLARRLHIRVEMRQIGVRDAARMLGGLGGCGQRLCCNRYLREFTPVSIRMAKNQDLVLNPERVSGICGRLLCCLAYEDAHYKEAARDMPRVGRRVVTPDGEGRVRDRDVMRRIVRLQMADESGLREYPVEQVSQVGAPGAQSPPAPANEKHEPEPSGPPDE